MSMLTVDLYYKMGTIELILPVFVYVLKYFLVKAVLIIIFMGQITTGNE